MGELKPLGSEKLGVNEKLKRILELTYYKEEDNSNTLRSGVAEYISESVNGVYGIVREKDSYYVKKGLNENTLDYIGGMFMKNKNRFSSYAEAFKRLDLLQGQEALQEETKYMLRGNKPPMEAAPAAPAMDTPPPATPDMGGEPGADTGMDEPMPEDGMGDEGIGGDEQDPIKVIQKLTGRLGQKLRAAGEELKSNDIKYIINSVLSAMNLDDLEEQDKEDILSKLENEGEDNGMGDEGMGGPDLGGDDMSPEGAEGEMGEEEAMDTLERLTNTPLDMDEWDNEITPDDYDEQANQDGEYEEPRTYSNAIAKEDGFSDYEPNFNPEDDQFDSDEEGNEFDSQDRENYFNDETTPEDNQDTDEWGIDNLWNDENWQDENDQEPDLDIDEISSMINNRLHESLKKYKK